MAAIWPNLGHFQRNNLRMVLFTNLLVGERRHGRLCVMGGTLNLGRCLGWFVADKQKKIFYPKFNIHLHHMKFISNQKLRTIKNLLWLMETLMLTVIYEQFIWKINILGLRMNLKNSKFEFNDSAHSQTYPKMHSNTKLKYFLCK